MVKLTEDLILMQSLDSSVASSSSAYASCGSSAGKGGDNGERSSSPDEFESCSPSPSVATTAAYRKINCWGSDIDDISILSQMPDVEVVVLSSNEVSDLSPLSNCKRLSQLFLRRNRVSQLSQLSHLKQLPRLKTLWLLDNPVAEQDNYRLNVINILPQLQKLDSKVISGAERAEASKLLGEVEVLDEKSEVEFKADLYKTAQAEVASSESQEKSMETCNSSVKVEINEEVDSTSESCAVSSKKVDEESERSQSSLSCVSEASSMDLLADRVAKTSIFDATQAVRHMGMKLYSAPVSSMLSSTPVNSISSKFPTIEDLDKTTEADELLIGEKSNTLKAIELLLDALTAQELQYLSQAISSKLTN